MTSVSSERESDVMVHRVSIEPGDHVDDWLSEEAPREPDGAMTIDHEFRISDPSDEESEEVILCCQHEELGKLVAVLVAELERGDRHLAQEAANFHEET